MAFEQNVTESNDFFVGTDMTLTMTVYQSGAVLASNGTSVTGTVQDITGWSLSWMIKRRDGDLDAAALLTKTTSAGIALTTPLSGLCTVTVADTDTDAIPPGNYHHELKRTDAGSESVLIYGRFVLKRALHRT